MVSENKNKKDIGGRWYRLLEMSCKKYVAEEGTDLWYNYSLQKQNNIKRAVSIS